MRRPRRPGGPGGSGGFGSLRLLVCLLLLSGRPGGCSAISAHGCLFDRRLCSHLEVCIQDGLFGQCQAGVGQARPLLQVTSPVLQRLQGVLRQLMSQGLSWHDDLTQHVISQEMERIPRLRPPEPHSRDRVSLCRPGCPGTHSVDQAGLELRNPPASASQVPGLKACTTTCTTTARRDPHVENCCSRDSSQMEEGRVDLRYNTCCTREESEAGGSLEFKALVVYEAELLPPLLEHLLMPPQPPHPALTYEPALLQPYLFHQFGSRDGGSRGSESSSGVVGVGHLSKAEGPALFSRSVSKAILGTHSGHSFGDLTGPSPAQLFQDSGLLYMAQELPVPGRVRAPRLPEDGGSSRAEDSSEGREEEALGARGEKSPPQTAQPDVGLQRLAAVLAGYGVEPRQLTPEQLSTLLTLLQSLPKGTGRTLECRLQARSSMPSQKESSFEDREREGGAANVGGADVKKTLEEQTQRGDTADARTPSPLLPGRPTASTPSSQVQQVLSPGFPEPPHTSSPLGTSSVLLEKKSPLGQSQPTVVGQPSARPSAEEYGYIVTDQKTPESGCGWSKLLEILAEHVHMSSGSFINISVVGPAVTFRIRHNEQNLSLADVTQQAGLVKSELEAQTGLQILQTGVGQREEAAAVLPRQARGISPMRSVLLTLVALAGVAGLLVALAVALCMRHHSRQREKERLAALGPEGAHGDTTFEYQDLCRQHMATKSLFNRAEGQPEPSRVSSVSSQFSDAAQASPSSHSSTPSWCEEPAQANMDISTGHMILAYMEDHLRNRDRLAKEWQALCAYQAEPNTCATSTGGKTTSRRTATPTSYPFCADDHARIKLKVESSPSRSDYINASPIIEHDPRMPAYIATQGPLSHTIADFWQMVWESGCTVIVMLTPLVEDGVKQCDRYWPDEGSSLYHVYEVNLVSEHIWCEDFLVRSFYLKNVQTQETRTLTQFHFLSWPAEGTPASTRPLLDFRRVSLCSPGCPGTHSVDQAGLELRNPPASASQVLGLKVKVNKCYRGRSCPIIVHCSDGAGRTGTYILIDMVLNRMAKGVKEIDIAATLEHVRDQRPGLVRSKVTVAPCLFLVDPLPKHSLHGHHEETNGSPPLPHPSGRRPSCQMPSTRHPCGDQFEFALTAVAEEVNAILKALPQ
ncbi:Protein tyrosine phosphatase receptor type N [Apodemus speciosus]|uniref:Protein tyrosine phosphatase receptor type N n=1 Tax=Apodemus speciosus TaxID=105296 RepID=A0ABQ0EDA8_APOSI